MKTIISTENKLQDILDFEVCKQLVDEAKAKNDTYIILCPHYSINIASKYNDGEELGWDLDELSDYIGEYVSVNDYDDLVVDMSINEDEDDKPNKYTDEELDHISRELKPFETED